LIDISGSMAVNDPQNIRMTAAQELNGELITKNAATNGKTADLVTVVYFNDSSIIMYPLGDPSGAGPSLEPVNPAGGTFIGGGIETTITELTKSGYDPTANRTSIVVFTDGIDDPADNIPNTIASIQQAGGLGIRVHFGYLVDVSGSSQDPGIELAVLQTGGVYDEIATADSQENFINLVLLKGLAGIDKNGDTGTSAILPGLTSSTLMTPTGQHIFTYQATAGESLNITVTPKGDFDLVATLHDASSNTDLTSQPGNSTTPAFLQYTAKSNIAVEVVVTYNNTITDGIFSVDLNSSLSSGGQICTPANITNTTTQPATPSPTISQFTGGASRAGSWDSDLVVSLLWAFVFAAFAWV
jgi:hypothetical protein